MTTTAALLVLALAIASTRVVQAFPFVGCPEGESAVSDSDFSSPPAITSSSLPDAGVIVLFGPNGDRLLPSDPLTTYATGEDFELKILTGLAGNHNSILIRLSDDGANSNALQIGPTSLNQMEFSSLCVSPTVGLTHITSTFTSSAATAIVRFDSEPAVTNPVILDITVVLSQDIGPTPLVTYAHSTYSLQFDEDQSQQPTPFRFSPTVSPVPTSQPSNHPPTPSPVSPTSKPTQAPVPSYCFSKENTVVVQGKKGLAKLRINELQIGDNVQTSKGDFSKVYSLAHNGPDTIVEYLQLYFAETTDADGGTTKAAVEISAEHMLFVYVRIVPDQTTANTTSDRTFYKQQTAIPAGLVKVGDGLISAEGDFVEVIQISKVKRLGAYAPYTQAGELSVNGILVSSYVGIPDLQRLAVGGVGVSWATQHWIQHSILNAPHRLLCHIGSQDLCQNSETYNADGYSNWVVPQLKLVSWIRWWFFELNGPARHFCTAIFSMITGVVLVHTLSRLLSTIRCGSPMKS